MENYIETPYLKLWQEDKILHGEYQPDLSITIIVASEIMALIKKACNDSNDFFMVLDMSNLKWIDKESRDFFAKEECTKLMKGWAFFSNRPIHKLMHIMYVSFSKPNVKTKFFGNKTEALEWVKGI